MVVLLTAYNLLDCPGEYRGVPAPTGEAPTVVWDGKTLKLPLGQRLRGFRAEKVEEGFKIYWESNSKRIVDFGKNHWRDVIKVYELVRWVAEPWAFLSYRKVEHGKAY